MKVLLDTHVWLWAITTPERLGERARSLISDGGNQLLLSAASAWEIAIKHEMGKLPLPSPPEEYVPRQLSLHRVSSLPISTAHALRAGALPAHHRDPFDRVLVAQAQLEGAALLTADPALRRYDVQVEWALPSLDPSGR